MEVLNIIGTDDTPTVNFNYSEGQFIISGRSLPEDVTSFYKPVISWLNAFSNNPKEEAKFIFKLEYFNTASSKILLDIFMKLEEISEDSGKTFSVVWNFQESDSDMQEAGEEYAELVTVPFVFETY